MKRIRKGKKMLILLLIAIVVIIAAVFIIKGIINITSKEPPVEEKQQIFELPETTYNNMEVKNIVMEYLKDNNETMITMEINNVTSERIEGGSFDIVWIGPNDEVLGKMPYTYIEGLNAGEQHDLSVILKGDLTATTQVKLINK